MSILQQASGTFNGTSVVATLPAASSASNKVVLFIAGNTTVSAATGWSLRTSQVNFMGHYLYDRAGGSASYTITVVSGQGTWWIAEIPAGVYDTAQSANNSSEGGNYTTPNLTPTAGLRLLLASIGSTLSSGTRTVSNWTNSFIEQVDVGYVGADNPMQGGALLDAVSANGTTAYSTLADFSAPSYGRSAIIVAYGYTEPGGGGVTGTLSASTPKTTGSAAGTVTAPTYTGTLSANLPRATSTISGTVTAPTATGTLSASTPVVTGSATGTVSPPVYTGSVSANVPVVTASGSGTVSAPVYTGTLSASVPRATTSVSGTVTAPTWTGTLSASVPVVTAASTGTVTAPTYTGTLSASTPVLTGTLTGTVTPPAGGGTLDASLPKLTATATGTVTAPAYTGTLTAPMPVLTSSIAGTVTPPAGSGTVNAVLPTLTGSLSGTVTAPSWTGTLTASTPVLTAALTGTVTAPNAVTGVLNGQLPRITTIGSGVISNGEAVLTSRVSGEVVAPTWAGRVVAPTWEGEVVVI